MQKIEVMDEKSENNNLEQSIPVWIWILLAFAVVGVSSAGTMFQQIDEIPPLLRASWRLQATSLVLLPLAVLQWRWNCDASTRERCFEKSTILIMSISGLSVGAHFGCWVASLDMTTLTHSLLFVSSHPVVVAFGMFSYHYLPGTILKYLESRGVPAIRKLNSFEVTGVFTGVLGAGITLLDVGHTQGRHKVTVIGDFVAFLGAVAFISYQVCGRVLREWMPLFVYAFPVTALGSALLLIVSLAVERDFSNFGVFGWATMHYIYWYLALSLSAGLLGHTGLNMCLKYLSPLTICSAVMLEPAIGSFLGWLAFHDGVPGSWTIAGGVVLIFSVFLVSYGTHEAAKHVDPATPSGVPEEAGLVTSGTPEHFAQSVSIGESNPDAESVTVTL
eukprot:GSChrysophyteH1.ASY1.ANO1.60.1 assembled CDS